jgi:hypothetical protein
MIPSSTTNYEKSKLCAVEHNSHHFSEKGPSDSEHNEYTMMVE